VLIKELVYWQNANANLIDGFKKWIKIRKPIGDFNLTGF